MAPTYDPLFVIETPRLLISHFDPTSDDHCDFLVQLYTAPSTTAGIGNTGIDTREKARGLISGFFASMLERNGYGPWLVSLKRDPSRDPGSSQSPSTCSVSAKQEVEVIKSKFAHATPVGTVTLLRGAEPDCFAVPDIGFIIHPDHARRGYTKEACTAAMEYTDKEYGVQGFLGMTDPTNAPAIAVFKSLGFTDHGVRPIKVFDGKPGAVWASKGLDLEEVGF